MFDAKELDSMAKKVVFDLARERISVGKFMMELLNWNAIEEQAKSGLWDYTLRPRDFSAVYQEALVMSMRNSNEINENLGSHYYTNGWKNHFDGFIAEMEKTGYTVTIAWAMLSESRYDFDGRNSFYPQYECKRNLWVGNKHKGYWGRPTVLIRWGKAVQLTEAEQILEEELQTRDGNYGDDGFLSRL
jgi:hypothetical protein